MTEFLKFNSLTYFYKNQLTFVGNIVVPLWEKLSEKHPDLKSFYDRIDENIKELTKHTRRNTDPPLSVLQSFINQRIEKLS